MKSTVQYRLETSSVVDEIAISNAISMGFGKKVWRGDLNPSKLIRQLVSFYGFLKFYEI